MQYASCFMYRQWTCNDFLFTSQRSTLVGCGVGGFKACLLSRQNTRTRMGGRRRAVVTRGKRKKPAPHTTPTLPRGRRTQKMRPLFQQGRSGNHPTCRTLPPRTSSMRRSTKQFHRRMGRRLDLGQTVEPSVAPPAAAAHMLEEEAHDAVPQAHRKEAQTVEPPVMPPAAAAHLLAEEVHDAVPQAHESAAQTVVPSVMPLAAAAHMLDEKVHDALHRRMGRRRGQWNHPPCRALPPRTCSMRRCTMQYRRRVRKRRRQWQHPACRALPPRTCSKRRCRMQLHRLLGRRRRQ
jgi:hypothetical protein